jgi:cell division septation protein DedD
VNLQIKAEVSARGDDVKVGQDTFPAFNTQDAETTAVVQDGETLVIGGLIGERKSKGRSGIPYLMDIPVIGRFFGTASDSNDRTELIMLITPRVIRNRDEGRVATAEFKSKLSTVRNELERMERDRARSQPPPPLPPMPDPNQYYQQEPPQPAPSKAPVGPRAALPPFAGNVIAPNREAAASLPSVPTYPNRENDKALPTETQTVAQANIPQTPELRNDKTAPAQPAYALSVVNRNAERPIVPVPKTPLALSKVPSARSWAVQVAAVNEQKDAENLAARLRKDGYDAYVVTVELASKRWYRVRVGQMESLKDAAELKNRLASSKSFKDAYVALR